MFAVGITVHIIKYELKILYMFMGEFFVNMETGTTVVGQSVLFQNTEKSFGPGAGQLQHSIYVNYEYFVNLKNVTL